MAKKAENQLSPMMTFYLQLKENYKDCIVLFRLGDFYEMFFDDAIKASKILDLTLTGRDCGLEKRAPMCGVPFHAVDGYIAKLISAGEKVAICEQLSNPIKGSMVERDVVRVITPGTIIEDNILDDKKNNYIACVNIINEKVGISWADISTGEFNSIELDCKNNNQIIEDMLVTINPAEIITNSTTKPILDNIQSIKLGKLPKAYMYVDSVFNYSNAYKKLTDSFKTQTLQIFECEGVKSIVSSAGALMEYLSDTQKRALCHINGLKVVQNNNFMFLDTSTRRNLEICQNCRDGKKYGSLLWVIDKTKTSMGARMIRNWLEQPLINSKKINARLDGVESLINDNPTRTNVVELLDKMHDIERIAGKIAYNSITPKDMISLAETLKVLPELKQLIKEQKPSILKNIYRNIDPMQDIAQLLTSAIDEEAGNVFRDGGFIKTGFNADLDELRLAKKNGKQWIADIEAKEKQETGIKNLKIGFNKVFGYYIEVTNSFKDNVPFRYIRKQTLTNAERFITEDLKKVEDTILGAEEKSLALELKLFDEIKKILMEQVATLKITANAISALDTLISLAEVALEYNYCKPIINEKINKLSISMGRHPVVEKIIGINQFVANDILIDQEKNRTMIITGPNMAGKSTYMRSVAIITLLAHIGSFVPAKSAEISITDRIFTRIGASDDLAFGQSTFMVEMTEVATILNNATDKSLLILDEIGRGTSTCDGLSIAWAVIEYITNHFKAKTLFSTHYHELTELEGLLDGVKNYKIMVTELQDQVIFTHKITRGGANKSFGIEVARLAGIPQSVLDRATNLSKKLEQAEIVKDTNAILLDSKETFKKDDIKQLSFFNNSISDEILEKINKLDTDNMTPMQAMFELCDIKEAVRRMKNAKN